MFLKTPFLKALACSSPNNIHTYYVAIFKDNTLAGIAIIQRVEMYLEDIFRKTSNNNLKRLGKSIIARIVRGNALIVGNLMQTGQHGLFFNAEKLSQNDYLETIFKSIEALSIQIKKQHKKTIKIVSFKDYFETDSIHLNKRLFTKNKLYKLQLQPNMILDITEKWNTIDDYILELKKKYKSRYKSALKKANIISKRELDLETIDIASDAIYKLYKNVSDNAKINSFILHKRHFFFLKKELKDQFKLFGYYLDKELVGFYTLILNNNQLETYFLGYNPAFQNKHQLYLNMLYDMLHFGINNQFSKVVYARTAMEIKSSIGAKPKPMYIYIKHTNGIANTVLKLLVAYLNPTQQWVERHPFKN